MDFEIKELGLTIATGGFALGVIYMILRAWGIDALKDLHETNNSAQTFVVSAIGTISCLVAGLVCESISERIGGGEGVLAAHPVFSWPVTKNQKLRFRSFFIITNESNISMNFKFSEVAKSILAVTKEMDPYMLASTSNLLAGLRCHCQDNYSQANTLDLLTNLDQVHPCLAGESWCYVIGYPDAYRPGGELFCRDGNYQGKMKSYDESLQANEELVNGVFFKAKNIVHHDPVYVVEMRERELRVNIMRDFLLICYLLFLFHVISFICAFIRTYVPARFGERSSLKKMSWASKFWAPHGKIFLIYVVGFWLAGISYPFESAKYNARVFGYCSTILATQKTDAAYHPPQIPNKPKAQ